jgi:hypothetical protein
MERQCAIPYMASLLKSALSLFAEQQSAAVATRRIGDPAFLHLSGKYTQLFSECNRVHELLKTENNMKIKKNKTTYTKHYNI